LWLGLKSSNVAFAFLFFASAARRYAGATSGFFAAAGFAFGGFTPLSFSSIACFR
jgi:hypothetical protein